MYLRVREQFHELKSIVYVNAGMLLEFIPISVPTYIAIAMINYSVLHLSISVVVNK